MNIVPSSQSLTMTSREIAELTGKDHKNVIRDIRSMLDELEKDGSNLSHPVEDKDSRGYTACFYLNRELTDTLLTGYSATARLRVVRRWHELEQRTESPALNPANLSRLQLIEIAMQAEQERLVLEHKVEVLEPKAEALDRIATSDGSMCITNAAKSLQVQPKQLFSWLQQHQWIFRRQGGSGWVAYQNRIQSGLMEHKVTTIERSDGSEKVVEQVLVTAKGLAKLSEAFGEEKRAA